MKWVNDCCLTPNDNLFTAISCRVQCTFQWDEDYDVHFVLHQRAELDFHSDSSLRQQFSGRYIAPLGHIILISRKLIPYVTPQCCGHQMWPRLQHRYGYVLNRKIGKSNNLKFGSNQSKGPKQDSQNQLRSTMPDGGEP